MTTTIEWAVVAMTDDNFAAEPSGVRRYVEIDPVERDVVPWYAIGSGCPESARHGRTVLISVPLDAVGEDVERILRARTDLLDALAAAYQGEQRDQQANRIGQWDREAAEAAMRQLGLALSDALTYWDAGAWLAGAMPTSEAIEEAGGIADWVENAAINADECPVHAEDVEAVLRDWLHEELSELEFALRDPPEGPWYVAPEDRGQIIECAYTSDEDYIWMRSLDRSTGSISYCRREWEAGEDPESFQPWNEAPDGEFEPLITPQIARLRRLLA